MPAWLAGGPGAFPWGREVMRTGEEGPEDPRPGGRAPRPAALPSDLWVIPQECWPGGDSRASRVHGAVRPRGSGCVRDSLTGPGDPV